MGTKMKKRTGFTAKLGKINKKRNKKKNIYSMPACRVKFRTAAA